MHRDRGPTHRHPTDGAAGCATAIPLATRRRRHAAKRRRGRGRHAEHRGCAAGGAAGCTAARTVAAPRWETRMPGSTANTARRPWCSGRRRGRCSATSGAACLRRLASTWRRCGRPPGVAAHDTARSRGRPWRRPGADRARWLRRAAVPALWTDATAAVPRTDRRAVPTLRRGLAAVAASSRAQPGAGERSHCRSVAGRPATSAALDEGQ